MANVDVLRILPSPYYADVTPTDATDVERRQNQFPTALSIGVAGTLRVHDLDGNMRNFSATELAIATIYPIRVKQVHSTGTTADEIKLYWDN